MSSTEMAKPCDICGDHGVFEAIITCCECKIARQHLYCMREFRTEAPQFWSCEECDQNKSFSPRENIKEHIPEALTQKVPSLMQSSTRVSGGPNKKALALRFNFKERGVNTGRTKYISCEEAVKLSSGPMKSEYPSRTAFRSAPGSLKPMPPPRERILTKTQPQETITKFEPHLPQPVVQQPTGLKAENTVLPLQNRGDAAQASNYSKSSRKVERTNTEREMKTAKKEVLPPRKEEADGGMHIEVPKSSEKLESTNTKAGIKNHTNVEAGSSDAEKPNLARGVPVSETHYTYIPALRSYWKGSFYLPNGHENFNDAFKAHPPSRVHKKVFETLKKMPENIYFELVPDHEVWMDIFPGYCPDKDDIGLYFFPRFRKRSEKCISIMDFLWSKNLLMKSYVDGVELLVLSSRLLQPHSQEFQGNYFLWGVFRSIRRQSIITKSESSTSIVVHDSLVQGGEVADTQPLLKVKSEPCDDVPPGFKRICKPRD